MSDAIHNGSRNLLVRCADYFPDFSCTAAQCESNCCRSWKVFIEKEVYR